MDSVEKESSKEERLSEEEGALGEQAHKESRERRNRGVFRDFMISLYLALKLGSWKS